MDTMLDIDKDAVPEKKHILTPIWEPTSQPPFIDVNIIIILLVIRVAQILVQCGHEILVLAIVNLVKY